MSTPEDDENRFEENTNPEEKSDPIENDLPLEKLIKLSKSFKTAVDSDLHKFKEEKMSMINEMSSMSCIEIPANEKHIETNGFSVKLSQNKHNNEDSEDLLLGKNSKIHGNLEQELESSNVQSNRNEFKQDLKVTEGKENDYKYTSSIRNKISELHQMLNFDQTLNEKTNYLKKIIEVENKCHYWIDKYDELHEKYLRLESKQLRIEKENCDYQMEISRIKIIENENSRLHQSLDKSNLVRKKLEVALESCHKANYNYQSDMEIARHKVKEALEMVEKTNSKKDKLVTDLEKSNEIIVKLENEFTDLKQEVGTKVNLEVNKVKTMYKDKLREANVELEFLRTEKQIMVNKIQQITREYETLNKKYTSLSQCVNESDVYAKKAEMLAQNNNEYEVKFNNLIADIEVLKEINRKFQERQRTEDSIEQKEMKINELIKHIEAQKQMVDMWRMEMYNMIEGFKHRINELKHNCIKLYKKNGKLKRIIDNSKAKYSISRKKRFYKTKNNKNSYFSSMSTST